jgi:hypothetical protein
MTRVVSDEPFQAIPRSTGEIITDAVEALRRSFVALLALALPFCAVELVLREFGFHFLSAATRAVTSSRTVGLDQVMALLPSLLSGLGLLLGSFLVQQLLTGGIFAIGVDLWTGERPRIPVALQRLAGRGLPLLASSVFFLLAIAVGPLLLGAGVLAISALVATTLDLTWLPLIGAAHSAFIAIVVFIVLTLRWSLYGVAVVTEGRALVTALRRSAELTAGRGLSFWDTPRLRLGVLFLVALALSSTLQSLFTVPRVVVAFLSGWSFTDGGLPGLASMPPWFVIPFGLVEVLTNAVVAPFSALLVCFFAFDLRVRFEGFDPRSVTLGPSERPSDVIAGATSPTTPRAH